MATAPRRILVRAPNWVGDVVMATPALRALRRAHAHAEIVVEGRRWLADLLQGSKLCDGFLLDAGAGLANLRARLHALRSGKFDWALILPDSPRAALGPFLARIPLRVGYARDPLRRLLVNRALAPPRAPGSGGRLPISMVERFLRITRALGCPDAGGELELPLRDAARDRIAERLRAEGVTAAEGIVVITPGASFGSSKLWPVEHFGAACDGIAERLRLRVVLAPAPGEEPIAAQIASSMRRPPVALCAPAIGLSELVALIAGSRLLLTNDTGPRHIAVALGRPVVVLMGPTDPRHTAHLLERQRVLREPVPCSPCHLKVCPIDHRCLVRLAPERAIAAAEELLA